MFESEIKKNVPHNFRVGILDGAFFGLGLGFASLVTIVPLFINSLTDAAVLIGLSASIHDAGWVIPQMFTASRVARLKRYFPMVMLMTIHERWPLFGLAIVALLVDSISTPVAVALAFAFLVWQGFGGGFTATAWQSMITKIIPPKRLGTFFGTQAAAFSITIAIGGVISGLLIDNVSYPLNYAAAFFLGGMAMMISMIFLGATREPEHIVSEEETAVRGLNLPYFAKILKGNHNLQMFMLSRIMARISWMAVAFYTVYGVEKFGMAASTAGLMLVVMTAAMTGANVVLGRLGDTWGHRQAFAVGMIGLSLSAMVAFSATSVTWMYVVFALAGIGHAGNWTLAMTMTLEFGTDENRPYYIGLINTILGPVSLLAPIAGGLLADALGYEWTFAMAAAAGLAAAYLLLFVVRDPRETLPIENVPMVHTAVGD